MTNPSNISNSSPAEAQAEPVDERAATELLRELVRQIQINDFTDSLGHEAKMLRPYREAVQLLGMK